MRSPKDKDLETLVDENWGMRQQCVLAAQKVSWSLGSTKSSMASRVAEAILHFYAALVRFPLEFCIQL